RLELPRDLGSNRDRRVRFDVPDGGDVDRDVALACLGGDDRRVAAAATAAPASAGGGSGTRCRRVVAAGGGGQRGHCTECLDEHAVTHLGGSRQSRDRIHVWLRSAPIEHLRERRHLMSLYIILIIRPNLRQPVMPQRDVLARRFPK